MKKGYWLTFVAVQTIGCVLPLFANIHSNPGPLVAGILLTMPGGLIIAFMPLGETIPLWAVYVVLLLINTVFWYAGWKILSWSRRRAEIPR